MLNLCVLILILLIGAGSSASCAKSGGDSHIVPKTADTGLTIEQSQSMRVLWTVSAYKFGPNATWRQEDADAMIFKTLDMNDNSITFDGITCKDVVFKRERHQLGDYLMRRYAMSPEVIEMVSEEVSVVKTSCTLPGFSEYIGLADRRLVIIINGVFFFLKPDLTY